MQCPCAGEVVRRAVCSDQFQLRLLIYNRNTVDLFSSLDKQPMSIQVVIIDALENVVLQWLCKHNLSCIPLKQWKHGLEEAMQLCSFSDCLRDIATVFAGSQFFQQLKACIFEQWDTSTAENDSSASSAHGTCTDTAACGTGQVMPCDCDRATNVTDTQQSESHISTAHLSSVGLPPYLSESTTDDVALTCASLSNKDASLASKPETMEAGILKLRKSTSRQKKTCQTSASKEKPVASRQESRKLKASLSVNKVDETLKIENSNSAGEGDAVSNESLPAADLSVSDGPSSLTAQTNRSGRMTRSSHLSRRTSSKRQPVTSTSRSGNHGNSEQQRDERLVNGRTVCEICGAVVKCLKSHLLKHGDPQYRCRYCTFATRQQQSLRIHEHRIHTNYRPHLCETCGKSFVKSTLLREHINEKHGSAKRERRYKCGSCAYTAYTRSILQRHEARHAPCRRPQYRCDVCGARLMTVYSLKEHKRLSHVDDRPFPCAICGFMAKSVKRLRSHMRCHGEKTFECDLCTKKFTMRAQLVRHQLVHSGLKPFVCPYCAYRSAIIENLRKHCHAVHKVLYPPKKRDVARSDDFTTAGQSYPDCTTPQGCSTLAGCTTSTVEGCTTIDTLALLPISTVLTSAAAAGVGHS